MKTLINTSAALFFFVLVITLVQTVHADTTNAQNFGDILNQAKNFSNDGASQNNNGSINTGSATAEQVITNSVNTTTISCDCTPTPSPTGTSSTPTPTPTPTGTITPTPTNTPGGGGDGGGNGNNNSSSGGGSSSSSPSTPGQVLGLSTTGGTNQTLQTLTLIASFLSALGGAFLLKKNA